MGVFGSPEHLDYIKNKYHCKNCGTEFQSKFCPNCGAPAEKKSKSKFTAGKVIAAISIFLIIISLIWPKKIIGSTLGTSNANAVAVTTTPKLVTLAEYKAACSDYDYQEVARNPDMYKGNLAHFRGQVLQVVQEEKNYSIYTINVTRDKYGNWSDRIYVQFTPPSGSARILEKDFVDVYGTLAGLKTTTTVLKNSVSMPALSAQFIVVLPK